MSSMFQKIRLNVKHEEFVLLSIFDVTNCHENYQFITNIYTNPTSITCIDLKSLFGPSLKKMLL